MTGKANGQNPLQRLKEAGFTPIPRWRSVIAESGLFSALSNGKNLMPRRPLRQLFWCGGKQGQVAANLCVVTAGDRAERGAVALTASFYGLFWRKLQTNTGSDTHLFFADPMDTAAGQTAYFDLPDGAVWCIVRLSRLAPTRRIGVIGKLTLSAFQNQDTVSLADALEGRDRAQLQAHLNGAMRQKERQTAQRVLERMIFLENHPEDLRLHRVLADIDTVMSGYSPPKNLGPSDGMFVYDSVLSHPYNEKVPLSKWIAGEAISLRTKAEGRMISVAPGASMMLRLLAASSFSTKLHVGKPSEKDVFDHNWISVDDIKTILPLKPAGSDL